LALISHPIEGGARCHLPEPNHTRVFQARWFFGVSGVTTCWDYPSLGRLATFLKRLPNGSQQLPFLIHQFFLVNLSPVGEKPFRIAGRSRS
jgi:hypothetical protein